MLAFDRLAVFPLFGVEDGRCGCGASDCKAAGKHPLMPYAQLGIAEKWQGGEDSSFGIATGHRSGVFVVDVDVRDDRNGLEALAAMGEFPETYTVKTPTGGYHFYFSLPDFPVKTSGNQVAPGVDIRGEGGFVVAPGMPHKNGGTYEEVLDVPPARAPEWLLALPCLRGAVRNSTPESNSPNAPIPIDASHPDWDRRLELGKKHCKEAEPSIEGAGGSVALLRVCIYLVRRLELPLSVARELVHEFYNPRCEPEWSDFEIDHKLESARDNSEQMPGIAPPTWNEMIDRAAAPKALRDIEGPPAANARRVHQAGHEYTFTPGETPAANEAQKTPSAEVAYILTANEAWAGVLQYDEFRRRVWAVDPPMQMDAEGLTGLSADDVSAVRMWLQTKGVLASKDDVRDAIRAAARRCSYHPVKEYLESCRSARRPGILDNAATCLFGIQSPTANMFFKRTLIAAVRRIYMPGTKVDTVLVLQGPQGALKSTCVRELFGAQFTRSQMPNLDSKDASNALRGYWGVELAEMDKVLRGENATVKEFLSRESDDYRRAYEADENKFPRECVFIGTTNDDDYLRDATGDRRYLPITVQIVDIAWLMANRDALWGEALALSETDEVHYIRREEEAQANQAREQFTFHDPWHDNVRDFLCGRARVRASEVYEYAIAKGGGDITKYGRAEQLRVTDTLKRLGCEQKKTNGERVWIIPAALASAPAVDAAKRFAEAIAARIN